MKLSLVAAITFCWPVVVEIPADGGKYEKHQFDAEFKHLSTSRFEALSEELRNGDKTDRQLAEEVLVGWKNIKDEDDQELLFTPENRDRLLEVPGVLRGITAAFIDATTGKGAATKAARKN